MLLPFPAAFVWVWGEKWDVDSAEKLQPRTGLALFLRVWQCRRRDWPVPFALNAPVSRVSVRRHVTKRWSPPKYRIPPRASIFKLFFNRENGGVWGVGLLRLL